MKALRIIRRVSGVAMFIGLLGLPGAIEFNDYTVPLILLIGGGIIFWTIERCYYFEDDYQDDFDDSKFGPYDDDTNDFYGY